MPQPKCSLDGCPNRVGAVPYTILGNVEKLFCSQKCASLAWDGRKKRSASAAAEESEETMNVPAEDFGDAGVVRKICDRNGCQHAVTLRWMGRYGEYCSNACMKLAESGDGEMTTTETTAAAPAAEKPITAGKTPAKKTAAAKKAAPKKSAKKAAPKTNEAAPKEAPAKDVGFGVFRPGTVKAAISEALVDGKYHSVAELKKICDETSTGYGQINWAFKELAERAGVEIEWKGDEKEEVRAKKPAKK